jgi:hypothetical protein
MAPKKTAPETGDSTPSPSLVQQIADLDSGKSVSLTERLDGDEATKQVIQDTRTRLRNTVAAAVKRAKDRTGATYTVEGGEITTRSLDILVVVAITRMS